MTKVYWIRNDQETDILTEGYVGITSRPLDYRIREHQQNGVMTNEDTVDVVYEVDTWEEGKVLEKQLRPEPRIGRNTARGGQSTCLGGRLPGFKQTKQHSEQISKALTGLKKSAEHNKNNSIAQKAFAQRPDYKNPFKDKKHTAKTRKRIKIARAKQEPYTGKKNFIPKECPDCRKTFVNGGALGSHKNWCRG
jgi:hypothetical protein